MMFILTIANFKYTLCILRGRFPQRPDSAVLDGYAELWRRIFDLAGMFAEADLSPEGYESRRIE